MVIWIKELKFIAEPAGCVGLAALLTNNLKIKGKNVVIIISGSNVSHDLLREII